MHKTRSIDCGFVVLLALCALIAVGKVAASDCPPNEFYTKCGGSCQTECATLNEPCLIRHIRCPDGCYCNEGFARNANGKCVPIAKCPKKKN